MDTFIIIIAILVAGITGAAIGVVLSARLSARRRYTVPDDPVRESLNNFSERLHQLETHRIEWHAQLREQVESVRRTNDELRRETASLSTALRKPHVRGQWGEMHLRRTAEIAGMIEHCDFDMQVGASDGERILRPDMVVRLTGGRSVVVDAKVPLEGYLDALEQDDATEQHLHRHAEQLRTHIETLAAKTYWRQFESSPEFIVLFVPSESMLSAALEVRSELLEHAATKKVVLATPTTLIALLRTVAYAWTQAELAENARKILSEAHELYDRIGTFAGHIDRLGKAIGTAVSSYNEAVGSLESRLLVTARRLNDLGVGDETTKEPRQIDTAVRHLTGAGIDYRD